MGGPGEILKSVETFLQYVVVNPHFFTFAEAVTFRHRVNFWKKSYRLNTQSLGFQKTLGSLEMDDFGFISNF